MKLLTIIPSSNKSKKWTAIFEIDGNKEKKVNFGATGYRDYTLMNSKNSGFYLPKKSDRDAVKSLYINRHKKREENLWKTSPMSPATLSRFILWSAPTMSVAVSNYRKKFKL